MNLIHETFSLSPVPQFYCSLNIVHTEHQRHLFLICFELTLVLISHSFIVYAFVYFQGTESIERSSPTLTKYWQQPADTCVHFQHNYKIGGKIDYIITFTSIKLYCDTRATSSIRSIFIVMMETLFFYERKKREHVFLQSAKTVCTSNGGSSSSSFVVIVLVVVAVVVVMVRWSDKLQLQ